MNAAKLNGSSGPASSGSASTPAKQVVYVDVDDEITTIIDKMNDSTARVVALVLPKRAGVFQSVVNMKLLKRRAESAKKHIVLITSESSLMPLAGLAGVHVAPTLQSKPEIPASNSLQTDDYDDDESTEISDADFDRQQNAATPVGSLASGAAGVGGVAAAGEDDVIQMDNSDKPSKAVKPAAPTLNSKLAAVKDKKPNVPNFFRFRKRFLLGGVGLVLLIIGWYFAYFVMPHATITVMTNSSDIDSRLAMTLDTAASTADEDGLLLPAQTKQEQKSNTQSVPATGQDNKGEKAEGSVIMSASVCGTPATPPDVAAGTGVSANSQTFITQQTASFKFDGISAGCIRFKSDAVTIAAQKGGASFNLTSTEFTVANRSDVKASGSAADGTDKIVKVVQQSDIDAATQKMTSSQDQTAIKRQLQSRLEDDKLYALTATFFAGQANTNTSSAVGEEADNVTVSETVTYTMFGVKQADLEKLIDNDLKKKINTSKQDILDNGLSKARITVGTPSAGPEQKLDIALTATAGPKLDVAKLKGDIKGMKAGEVKDRVSATPGVESVSVKYSPFWVTKAPKAEKISVEFEKATATNSGDTGNEDAAGND